MDNLRILFVILFCIHLSHASSLSGLASNGDVTDANISPTQKVALAWLIPQLGVRSSVNISTLQEIIIHLLKQPHFPLRNVINSYILQTDDFLQIEDKYILISYITNYTHFAQTYVNEAKISPKEFVKIIDEAKDKNHLNRDFQQYIEKYYSLYAKIDRQITATKYGSKVRPGIIKAIEKVSDAKLKSLLYARLYVRGNSQYKYYYDYNNKHNINSEMLIFDKILYHYKRKNYSKITEYIAQLPQTLHNGRIWWEQMQVPILHLMENNFKDAAYLLLKRIHLNTTHENYVRKEMVTGAVAMLLGKANHAFENFYNIYNNAEGVDEKAQGAYFMGQSYLKMGNVDAYRYWLQEAIQWPMTFYGSRAIDELLTAGSSRLTGSLEYLTGSWHKENQKRREIYKKQYNKFIIGNLIKGQKEYTDLPPYLMLALEVADHLKESGYLEYAKSFILKTVSHLEDMTMMKSLLEHICSNYNKYICADAKDAAEAIGYIDVQAFKTIKSEDIEQSVKKHHLPLLHAIIKKESNFKKVATSSAGAKGMMQVMPSTAKFICSKHNIKYSYYKLQNDAGYSIALGSLYLNDLLKMYNGSYIKALAAYNAGHGNVAKWSKTYIDSPNYQDSILMIELIPFPETRNYVKKVIMWEGIYEYIFSLKKVR